METKQALSNTFSDGLNTDLHPLITPNTVLTDCINGTIMTNNGNEYNLQNDFGNYELKNAKLPVNYIPVGMKEYNGIIYIVSYNPITKRSQIGSFPSPQQQITSESVAEGEINQIIINNHTTNTYLSDDNCFYSRYKTQEQSIYLESETIHANDYYEFTILEDDVTLEPFQKVRLQIINQSGKTIDLGFNEEGGLIRFNETISGKLKISNFLFGLEDSKLSIKNKILPTIFKENSAITADLLQFVAETTVKFDYDYELNPELELHVQELDENENVLNSNIFYLKTPTNKITTAGITTYSFEEVVRFNALLNTKTIKITAVPYVKSENKTIVFDTYIKQMSFKMPDEYNSTEPDYDESGVKYITEFTYKTIYSAGVPDPVLSFNVIWTDESLELNGQIVESLPLEYEIYSLNSSSNGLYISSNPIDERVVQGQNVYQNDPDSRTFKVNFDTVVPMEELYVLVLKSNAKTILRTLIVASESINNVQNEVDENMKHFSDYSSELTFDTWAKVSNIQFDDSYEKVFEAEQYVKANNLDELKTGQFISNSNYFKINPVYTSDFIIGKFIKTTNRFNLKYGYNSGSGLWENPELDSDCIATIKTTFEDASTSEYTISGTTFDVQSISGLYNNITKDEDVIKYIGNKYYLLNECPFNSIENYTSNVNNEINAFYFSKQSNSTFITDLYKSQNTVFKNKLSPFEAKEITSSYSSFELPLNAKKLATNEDVSLELNNALNETKMFFNPVFIDSVYNSGYSVPHYLDGSTKIVNNPILRYGASTIGLKTSGEKTFLTIPMWGSGCGFSNPWMYDYTYQTKLMQLLSCNIYSYRKQDVQEVNANLIKLSDNLTLRTTSVDVNMKAKVSIKDLKYKGLNLVKDRDLILSVCGITPERCGILNSKGGAVTYSEQKRQIVQGVTVSTNDFKDKTEISIETAKKESSLLKDIVDNNKVCCDIENPTNELLQNIKDFADNLEFKNDSFYLKPDFNSNKIDIKPQTYQGSTNTVKNYCGNISYNEWGYTDTEYTILQCSGPQNNILSIRNSDLTEKWTLSEIESELKNLSQSFKDAVKYEG